MSLPGVYLVASVCLSVCLCSRSCLNVFNNGVYTDNITDAVDRLLIFFVLDMYVFQEMTNRSYHKVHVYMDIMEQSWH